MNQRERDALVAAAATAHRARTPDGRPLPLPAWHDLDADGRAAAVEAALALRAVEAAANPEGLSSTAHAVLARIPKAP
jgi:hypothetical protein